MHKNTLVIFVVFSLATQIQTALADNVYSKQPMTIGIIGATKWGEANGNPITGIMREQSKVIFNMANIYATHRYALYPRLVKQLKRGSIDCAILAKEKKYNI